MQSATRSNACKIKASLCYSSQTADPRSNTSKLQRRPGPKGGFTMNTIVKYGALLFVILASSFVLSVVRADEPVSAPVASTPAVSAPSVADIPAVKAGMEAAAKDYAAKVEQGIANAVAPKAPQRTWTQAAGDGLGALVDGGRFAVCQAGRGIMNVDGAAAALARIPSQYVEEVAFSAATTCNAASR